MTSGRTGFYSREMYRKTCLLLCSLFLSILLAEGLLQLFPPCQTQHLPVAQNQDSRLFVSHPYIGHLQKASHSDVLWGCDFKAAFNTDAYGFRNPWPWPEKVEFVALGDSFTFGFGVEDEEAWPAVLAKAVPNCHILNLGLMAASPQQYLRIYETFGPQKHPSVLLVGLFLGNDFHEAATFDRWVKSRAGGNDLLSDVPPLDLSLRHPLTGTKRLLIRYSYLYNLVHEVMNGHDGRRSSERRAFLLANGHQLLLFPTRLTEAVAMGQPGREEFQLVSRALDRISSIARENGTYMLVVFQPSKEETYLPLLGESAPDPGEPLRLTLEKMGVNCLDLTPAFRRRAMAGDQLFFEVDGHPNRLGYRLIAEQILAHLTKTSFCCDT